MTILVVDDSPDILKFLKAALSKAGFTVVTADSARNALDFLANITVNLIITDVNMPEMDGNEFCERVRQNSQLSYIPILVLTALSTVDDMANSIAAGADDYLNKPIRLRELLAKVREYAM